MSYFPDDFLKELKEQANIKKSNLEASIKPPKPKKDPNLKKKLIIFVLILSFIVGFFFYNNYKYNQKLTDELITLSKNLTTISEPGSVILKIETNRTFVENLDLKKKEKLIEAIKRLNKLKEEEQQLLKNIKDTANKIKEEGKINESTKEYEQLEDLLNKLGKVEKEIISLKKELGLDTSRNEKILMTYSISTILINNHKMSNKELKIKEEEIKELRESQLCKYYNFSFCR